MEMIEVKTANIAVETEYAKLRMKDFRKHILKEGLNMDEEFSSWPDHFEEDWE